MKNRVVYFILVFGLLNSFLLKAQTTSPDLSLIGQKLTTALSDYYKRYPQEKIFLHTDQSVYLGGQTIWYKAYALAYGKPSLLSKILYVRLSDANSKLVKQDMLSLKSSTAYGNIDLPDSLPTGSYHLRAFTAWMLNFDEDGIYRQDIYIQNIHDTVNRASIAHTAKTYHINFFPEGGDLVEGDICNIAFKATDEDGLPVKVYGDVLEDNKKPVAMLVTVHDGMGSFELETYANANYNVQVHFPDSSVQQIALPKVKKTGVSMRIIASTAAELEVKIAYTGQPEEYKNIIVAAVQNNGLCTTYPLQLNRGINVFSFKKNNFSTGMLRLTVFDERVLPLAERIVYINNNDQLSLLLNKDTLAFDPKSKNVFTLNLKDNHDQPVKANLSLAVTDANNSSEPDDNICSYFLMSSELHGYIHHPAYYFKNNSDTLQKQLDLVMLTSGWRHFKWDTVLRDKAGSLKYAVERTLIVAGKIENYHDKDNLKLNMLITNRDSSKKLIMIEPDSAGVFILKDYAGTGTANISYEVMNKKNRRQALKVTFFKRDIDTVHFMTDALSGLIEKKPGINKTFLDSVKIDRKGRFISKGITLKTVNIKAKELSPTEILIKNHVRHLETDNAYTFDLVNNPPPPLTSNDGGVIAYLQGKIPGLQMFQKADGTWHFAYHGQSSLHDTLPVCYIDEANVGLGDLIDIPITEIALVRFAPPPVWFAPLNGGFVGAILVYTKRFGDEKYSYSNGKGFEHYTFNSYSVTREFPSPDYSVIKHNQAVDYRTTLYWNHDLGTDDHGNIKIHFYNSDKAKKYRAIIQAMDAEGRIGYLKEEF